MPTPAEIAAAETALGKEIQSLRGAVKTFKEHFVIQEGRKPKLKETEIPQEILTDIPPPADIISRLPGELQEMVWKEIDPTDRVALALTCKTHANMYHELKDKKVKREGKMVRRLPRPLRVDRASRLKVLVRLRHWMPKTHRLCYSCGLYIDTKKAARHQGQWGGNNRLVESGLATNKAIKEGPRCPLCVRRDSIAMAKHKREWLKYLQLLNSVKAM